MKKDLVLNTALGILTTCAVVTTGLVVRREFLLPRPQIVQPRVVPAWRTFAAVGHRMGPTKAAVNIVVFSDFECPYCGALMKRLHSLRNEYPKAVAVVYRHFPMQGHRYAIAAARASECAAAQGDFEPFHDALFANQDSIGRIPWEKFATIAGVQDLRTFRACVIAANAIPAIARDTAAGKLLGVTATPTLLINETELVGAQPLDTLEAYVARTLKPIH